MKLEQKNAHKSSPMTLISRRVGRWALNTYVLICPDDGCSVLIDPGAEPDVLVDMLAGTTPVAILITHSHPDHVEALDAMRNRLRVPVMAHPQITTGPHPQQPDRSLADGDLIDVGRHQLVVRHTPGHTPDQICFGIKGDHRMVVGDTIFKGGPGRTWSVQDFQTTLATLRDVVLYWPDETYCYPGHGLSFNLGEQRQAIDTFLNQDHGAFYGNATWDMAHTQ